VLLVRGLAFEAPVGTFEADLACTE
jgi:hypothetical protein